MEERIKTVEQNVQAQEILFQQYKLYTEQKDKFVDRSFQTNKFYQIFILALISIMFFTRDYSFAFGMTSTLVFAATGLSVCYLWWINVDSYNFLIKIKLSKVIEELEKSLPVQPFTQEFISIKDLRKKKREFLFADMQKAIATLAGIFFFALFLNELVGIVAN